MKAEKHPLCKQCLYFTHDFVPSEGPLDAGVVFVGDSPWRQEAKYGRPLIGPAGEVFNALLETTGFDRRDVFVTNTIHCLPEALGVQHPKEVVELCTKLYLKRELAKVKAKLIVPMGNVALKALGIKQAITSVRGTVKVITCDDKPYKVLPTYHPSFLLRKPAYVPFGEKDFHAVRYYLDHDHEPPPNDDLDYRSVTTPTDIEAFFVDFEKAKRIAWDTETTGLDYRTDEILAMQWSFAPKTGYCMPFFHLPYAKNKGLRLSTTYTKAVIGKLYDLLHDMEKVYFFHNGKFDLRMMHRFFMESVGLPLMVDHIRWHDTMAMYSLLDENTSKSLKSITPMYTDLRYVADDVADVKGGRMKAMTLEHMTRYGITDTDSTRRIALKFGTMLREQNLWDIYAVHTASDMKIANVLFKMEIFGAPIDKKELMRLKDFMKGKLQHYYDRMKRTLGYDFNPNSDPQLRKVLFDDLGFPTPEKKTPGGQISTDKFVIADLIACYPANAFLHNFRMHREYTSIEETFVSGLEKKLGDDGRLHPDFGFTSMVSGRVACYKPNLTNIPREKEFEEGIFVSIRSLFRSVPGKKVIYADCMQVEFKVAAVLSGDQALIKALFVDHEDFHSLVARALYPGYREFEQRLRLVHTQLEDRHLSPALLAKLKLEQQSLEVSLKTGRTRSKNFNFGRNYGAQPPKLAECLGTTEEKIASFLRRLSRRFPDFEAYLEETPQRAIEEGELVTPFGRKRRFPPTLDERVQESQARQGSNFLPQCHVFGTRVLMADLTWRSVEELQQGDSIGSFDEHPAAHYGHRHWRTGKIVYARHDAVPCFNIYLENGDVVTVTKFHWHLTVDKYGLQSWVRTDRLWFGGKSLSSKFGPATQYSRLSKVIIPTCVGDAWDSGYIAGMFDADGSLHGRWEQRGVYKDHRRYKYFQLGQMPNAALTKVCEILQKYSFIFSLSENSVDRDLKRVTILGGQPELLRFLQTFRPPRLLEKFTFDNLGHLRTIQGSRVMDIVPVGKREIVRLKTSDGTYVADGYATHNSSAAYAVRAALVRIAWAFERTGMNAYPFNQVYDCIIVEAPDDEVEDAATIMAQEMLAPVPELGNHVFGIELGVGQSWKLAESSAVKLYAVEDLPKLQSLVANEVGK